MHKCPLGEGGYVAFVCVIGHGHCGGNAQVLMPVETVRRVIRIPFFWVFAIGRRCILG